MGLQAPLLSLGRTRVVLHCRAHTTARVEAAHHTGPMERYRVEATPWYRRTEKDPWIGDHCSEQRVLGSVEMDTHLHIPKLHPWKSTRRFNLQGFRHRLGMMCPSDIVSDSGFLLLNDWLTVG